MANSSESDSPFLDLSCRSLKELPRSLRGAQQLNSPVICELSLAFNALTSLLGVVEACPSLERLTASHNQLRSLPDLGSLLCLRRLDLSHNKLGATFAAALPAALPALTSLKEVSLAHNNLGSAAGAKTIVALLVKDLGEGP